MSLKLGVGSSAGVLRAEWSFLSSGVSVEVVAFYVLCGDVGLSCRFLGISSLLLWKLPGRVIGRVTVQWDFCPYCRYDVSLVVTLRVQ